MQSATVRITEGATHETDLVKIACAFKAIPFTSHPSPEGDISLSTQTIEVHNTQTILSFLDAKYPAPPLVIGDPETKAGIHMILCAYLDKPERTVAQLLDETKHANPWLLGEYPTIVDLMLVDVIEDIEHRPYQFRLEELISSWEIDKAKSN